ncbi:hypothetical protein [Nocardioides bizhenqiangii]|uniref:Uncharacterized protein n=1 Tax=Nocardioides bizhenqiangii TaxID=3095076 RepID=A0ABZ0ZQ09_9ACTN|nr:MULTISPECIES: hypothetical protein [unclassified Nocardioides]MDZ5621312.1 hypothetical protein [Nocardioides sp. HM23]WQQ25846.1 hypothetical protein SHK19_18000 [Nocardioides sp. HM61]
MDDRVIYEARASVLADLQARGVATAGTVSVLDEACSQRRWWVQQWPEGAAYIAGLIAQDVQDALVDVHGRADRTGLWPLCEGCGDAPLHALHIAPDLGGPDPSWVCDESGTVVAELGRLGE